MNFYAKLCERAAQGRPLRVGLIGAGKFGSMYLAQVPKTPGVHRWHRRSCAYQRAHQPATRRLVGRAPAATSLAAALASGATHVSDDWRALVAHPRIDIDELAPSATLWQRSSTRSPPSSTASTS